MKSLATLVLFFVFAPIVTGFVPIDKCLNFHQTCLVYRKVIEKDFKPDKFLTAQAFECVVNKTLDYIDQTACIKNKPLQDFMIGQQTECQAKFQACITEEYAIKLLDSIFVRPPKPISAEQKECSRNNVMALEFSETEGSCAKSSDVFTAFNNALAGSCEN